VSEYEKNAMTQSDQKPIQICPSISVWSLLISLSVLAVAFSGAYWMASNWSTWSSVDSGLLVKDGYLNIGEVWEEASFRWKLPVVNRGKQRVKVLGFSSTCSCVAIQPSAFAIDPDGIQELQAVLDLTQRSKEVHQTWDRRFEVTLFPQVKGKPSRAFSWVLGGTIKASLLCSPASVDFGGKPILCGDTPPPTRGSCNVSSGT
jgi:hypothetical protein